jgi:hypothetical protein
MKKLTSTADVLDALGGTAAAARLLGIKRSTVSMWKVGGRFPSSSYLALSDVLRSHGIECPPELWGMVPPKRSRTVAVRRALKANP